MLNSVDLLFYRIIEGPQPVSERALSKRSRWTSVKLKKSIIVIDIDHLI